VSPLLTHKLANEINTCVLKKHTSVYIKYSCLMCVNGKVHKNDTLNVLWGYASTENWC